MNMSKKIVAISGDGVGPEIISSAVNAIEALTNDMEVINADAGYDCYQRTGEVLPIETVEAILDCDSVIMGPIELPADFSARDPTDDLKKKMGLYTNVRFIKKIVPDVGMVDINAMFFREENHGNDFFEARDMDGASITRKIQYSSCKRMMQLARRLAESQKKDLMCVHNVNNFKIADKVFLNTFYEVMEGSKSKYSDENIEGASSSIIMEPGKFEYVVSLNPYSDILSSEAAALAGGAHLMPEATLGDDVGLFRPMHGPLERLKGLNQVNPTAMLLATGEMLRFLGYKNEGEKLKEATRSAYKRGFRTPDVGGTTGTYDFTEQVVKICMTN